MDGWNWDDQSNKMCSDESLAKKHKDSYNCNERQEKQIPIDLVIIIKSNSRP